MDLCAHQEFPNAPVQGFGLRHLQGPEVDPRPERGEP
jgi:hypothetical protein